jgi:solute carrier family 25 thiamine pyrophosphate transporter 19
MCLVFAARGIVREHGVRGLYRGLGVTVLEIMPYAALQFGLYDAFNKAYDRARVRPTSAVHAH